MTGTTNAPICSLVVEILDLTRSQPEAEPPVKSAASAVARSASRRPLLTGAEP
jgi:hypothetical protein